MAAAIGVTLIISQHLGLQLHATRQPVSRCGRAKTTPKTKAEVQYFEVIEPLFNCV